MARLRSSKIDQKMCLSSSVPFEGKYSNKSCVSIKVAVKVTKAKKIFFFKSQPYLSFNNYESTCNMTICCAKLNK